MAIAWVEDYEGQDDDLRLSQETAEGFAEALRADLVLTRRNHEVVEGLFLPGANGAHPEVEKAHVLYFSGHGTDDGAQLYGGGVARFDKVTLGVGDLAFAVFDSCKTMGRAAQWKPAFQGLHYMLGFSGDVRQDASRGRRFAELLQNGERIPRAWEKAATETHGDSWVSLRADLKGRRQDDEIWRVDQAPAADPGPPLDFLYLAHQVGPLVLPPDRGDRQRVRLFRTFEPAWLPAAAESLLESLGLEGVVWERLPDGSYKVSNERGSLELYDASASFWWTGNNGSEEAAPSGGTLSSVAAKARSLGLLKKLNLPLAKEVEPRTSVTMLTRESHDGRQIENLLSERHATFYFEVDGLPALGPGAQARVSHRGDEMRDLLVFWRKTSEPDDSMPIISRHEAASLARSDPAFARIDPSRVKLNGSTLGYYALPPRERQDCLIPVYAVQGVVKRRSSDFHFIRYVQAVPESVRSTMPHGSVLRTMPTVFV